MAMSATYSEASDMKQAIDEVKEILIVQADNPDADSLSSALALEAILENLGKKTSLYCGVDLPSYLRYLPGWDRVSTELPKHFELSIIVDTSSDTLLGKLAEQNAKGWLAARPSIIIDHHATKPTIDFAKILCSYPAVSTTEIIYELSNQLSWTLPKEAKDFLAIGILSDSLGLMSSSTTARSIHIIGELVESGVDLPAIENLRRETLRKDPELIHYKGSLLQRVEFYNDNKVAIVTIPWKEIEKFSPLYNPPMLVLDDMRLGKGTDIAIAFKIYSDGKITAKIRANYKKGIADKLAELFGGGGHPYAAGFKISDGRDYETVKNETIKKASELLDQLHD